MRKVSRTGAGLLTDARQHPAAAAKTFVERAVRVVSRDGECLVGEVGVRGVAGDHDLAVRLKGNCLGR
jgi:hypothetical protein